MVWRCSVAMVFSMFIVATMTGSISHDPLSDRARGLGVAEPCAARGDSAADHESGLCCRKSFLLLVVFCAAFGELSEFGWDVGVFVPALPRIEMRERAG